MNTNTRFVDHAIRDTRYGLRLLRRSPIFTSVAILSLALGIGANAAIFHLIDTIQLRTLAIPHPEELAEVRPDGPQAFGTYDGVNAKATGPLWELIRANQSAFSTMFAWGDADFIVGRGSESRRARGLWVSGDFFGALGIAPVRGRLLGPDDDRSGCVAAAVISHGFWQSAFGGRENAIGSALTVLDQPVTVIGVAPASFTGLEVGETFDIALPLCSTAIWDGRMQPTRSLVADDHGPPEARMEHRPRERAPARVEPRRSRRDDSARLRRRPCRRIPPPAVRCRSCGTRRQPAARRARSVADVTPRPHQPRAAHDMRQSRDAHARARQRPRAGGCRTRGARRLATPSRVADADREPARRRGRRRAGHPGRAHFGARVADAAWHVGRPDRTANSPGTGG